MPNHVTNELQAAKHVIDSLAGPERAVDFNTVIPMPEIMRADSSSPAIADLAKFVLGFTNLQTLGVVQPNPTASFRSGDYGAAADALNQQNMIRTLSEGPFPKDFSDADFETLIKYMRALRQHGYAEWYEWSIANWGTKWNAYDVERRSDTVIRFDTAWSAPGQVLLALSNKFPDESIRLRWADEDYGNNTGDVTAKSGEPSGEKIQDGSPEAYALVLDLKCDGSVPEDYRLEAGKLVYAGE